MTNRQDSSRFATALGHAIRQRRVESAMSQEAFAEKVGVHRTYIGSVERGERNVSLDNILRISAALGMRPSELFALAEAELAHARA